MIKDEQRRGAILADCIERLQAGETAADCLARYGAEAAALAPLLSAAVRLQRVNDYRLTVAQRGQAKATLRAAVLSQNRHAAQPAQDTPWRFRFALPGPMRGLALAGMLAVALCVVATVTAVAASQPGDLAYPVRVLVERAPVLLQTTAAAKTTTELRIADRRLVDLETHLAAQGELAPAAVEALLAGDQAATSRAGELSQAERVQTASQLAAHAATLARLAQAARQPAARETLQAAASQVETFAQHLMGDATPDGAETSVTPGPAETPTGPAGQNPPSSSAATHTPLASGAPPATPSPVSVQPTRGHETPTARPLTPGHRATALAQTATASPGATPTSALANPTVSSGTPGSGRTGTPMPGRRATALAQTATAPAPSPGVTHTPATGPDTPVPGRRATALAQTSTAPAPASTDTPAAPVLTPTRRPDTPVPGRRATAQAQTATPAGATNAPALGPRETLTPPAP